MSLRTILSAIILGATASTLWSVSDPELNKLKPFLKQHCYQCHGPEKQKGDYRMDDPESLFAGGESDIPAIVPFQAMNSYLVELITLPSDDEYVMPPEGKTQLSNEEIVQIIRWVGEGAEID